MTIMKWQREREIDKFHNTSKWRSRYFEIEMPNKLFHLESSMNKYGRKVGSVRIIENTYIHMKDCSEFNRIAFRNEWRENGLDMPRLTHSNFDYSRESWMIFCFVSSSSVHPMRNFISDIDILLSSFDIRVLCRKTKFLIYSVLIMRTFSCGAFLWVVIRCLDESIIVSWAIQRADRRNVAGALLSAPGRRKVPQVGKYSKRRRAVRTVTYTFYISEMSRLGRRDAYVGAADPGSQSYHVISWHTVVDALEIWLPSIFRVLSAWCVRSLSISCVSSSAVAISLNVDSIPDTHAVKVFVLVENEDPFLRRISPESRHSQTRGTSTRCRVRHEASRMEEQLIVDVEHIMSYFGTTRIGEVDVDHGCRWSCVFDLGSLWISFAIDIMISQVISAGWLYFMFALLWISWTLNSVEILKVQKMRQTIHVSSVKWVSKDRV